jgi:hypothetical protein
VYFVQVPPLPAGLDGIVRHPQRQQLPPRHDPMLPPRQRRNLAIPCASGQLTATMAVK